MKTIEEAANDYSDEHGFRVPYNVSGREIVNDDYYDKVDVKASKEGFLAGVEFAQRWIPVEEGLPELEDHVLLKLSNGKITIGNLMDSGFNVILLNERNVVSHWRPIEYK